MLGFKLYMLPYQDQVKLYKLKIFWYGEIKLKVYDNYYN